MENKKGSLADKINFGGKSKKDGKKGFMVALSDKMKKKKIKKMAKKKMMSYKS